MTEAIIARPSRRRRPRIPRALRNDRVALTAAIACVLLVAVALLAPLLAPDDPTQGSIVDADLGITGSHLLGADALGRDLLSRLLFGARLSLLGPALVVALCMSIGTTVAIGSVWIGGAVDRAVARVLDVIFSFPALLLAVLAVAILGAGFVAPVIALSVAYVPYVARVVRSVALRERHLPYIDACQALGYSGWRICVRHILPNVRLILVAQATIMFASALMDLAAISFLGLGVQPPSSDWGTMVASGASQLFNNYPLQTMTAGIAIVVTVVAFNVLGERLTMAAERGE
jgi:peptide/nickel transport system permease protein